MNLGFFQNQVMHNCTYSKQFFSISKKLKWSRIGDIFLIKYIIIQKKTKPVPFTSLSPFFLPGLSILEITLPEASEVGEITVRNYYTAWLSVYVKYVNLHTHVDYGTGKE